MRFAGDFFGVPLTTAAEEKGSVLADYFPELKKIQKGQGGSETGARGYGNTQAVTPFTGFKTMEGSPRATSAPQFFGFKTFEQAKAK
jgi:hypothetical protein